MKGLLVLVDEVKDVELEVFGVGFFELGAEFYEGGGVEMGV